MSFLTCLGKAILQVAVSRSKFTPAFPEKNISVSFLAREVASGRRYGNASTRGAEEYARSYLENTFIVSKNKKLKGFMFLSAHELDPGKCEFAKKIITED